MTLSNEQAKQLHEKLAAEKNPEEAAKAAKEYGIDISTEDMEKILDQVSGGGRIISEDMLAQVSGGEELDIPEEIYEAVRVAYDQGGPQLAFPVCIYYIPSPLCNEIVYGIEEERRKKGLLSGR